MPFAVTQQRFRFYNDDGTVSTATAAAAENTNLTITDGGGNKSYHLLIQMQETGATNGATTDDWQLQYSKNAGAWTDVTTTSTNVKAFDSTNLTDADAIANPQHRLTAGTGSAESGEISEDGLVDDRPLPASGYMELLYTIQTVDTDLAATDTLDFRVLYNGATTGVTYSVTPRITNAAGGTTYNETISETATPGDSFSAAVTFNATISETATPGETLASIATYNVTLSETATPGDSYAGGMLISETISETATPGDSYSATAIFNNLLTETATPGDSYAFGGFFKDAPPGAVALSTAAAPGTLTLTPAATPPNVSLS